MLALTHATYSPELTYRSTQTLCEQLCIITTALGLTSVARQAGLESNEAIEASLRASLTAAWRSVASLEDTTNIPVVLVQHPDGTAAFAESVRNMRRPTVLVAYSPYQSAMDAAATTEAVTHAMKAGTSVDQWEAAPTIFTDVDDVRGVVMHVAASASVEGPAMLPAAPGTLFQIARAARQRSIAHRTRAFARRLEGLRAQTVLLLFRLFFPSDDSLIRLVESDCPDVLAFTLISPQEAAARGGPPVRVHALLAAAMTSDPTAAFTTLLMRCRLGFAVSNALPPKRLRESAQGLVHCTVDIVPRVDGGCGHGRPCLANTELSLIQGSAAWCRIHCNVCSTSGDGGDSDDDTTDEGPTGFQPLLLGDIPSPYDDLGTEESSDNEMNERTREMLHFSHTLTARNPVSPLISAVGLPHPSWGDTRDDDGNEPEQPPFVQELCARLEYIRMSACIDAALGAAGARDTSARFEADPWLVVGDLPEGCAEPVTSVVVMPVVVLTYHVGYCRISASDGAADVVAQLARWQLQNPRLEITVDGPQVAPEKDDFSQHMTPFCFEFDFDVEDALRAKIAHRALCLLRSAGVCRVSVTTHLFGHRLLSTFSLLPDGKVFSSCTCPPAVRSVFLRGALLVDLDRTLVDNSPSLAEQFPGLKRARISYQTTCGESREELVSERPGVVRLLKVLAACGLRVVLVTKSRRARAHAIVRRLLDPAGDLFHLPPIPPDDDRDTKPARHIFAYEDIVRAAGTSSCPRKRISRVAQSVNAMTSSCEPLDECYCVVIDDNPSDWHADDLGRVVFAPSFTFGGGWAADADEEALRWCPSGGEMAGHIVNRFLKEAQLSLPPSSPRQPPQHGNNATPNATNSMTTPFSYSRQSTHVPVPEPSTVVTGDDVPETPHVIPEAVEVAEGSVPVVVGHEAAMIEETNDGQARAVDWASDVEDVVPL